MLPETETTYTVKELIARVEGKIDVYTQQMSERVNRLEERMIRFETTANEKEKVGNTIYLPRFEKMSTDIDSLQLKTKGLYVWGLVVLFAGSAAGQMIAKWLVV